METSNKLIGEQLSLWTSSAADIHANHSALQDNAKEQTTQDTYGHGYEQPLANYNLDTQSWRMCVDISLWEEHKSLENLPKSGMTQNGVLYQQPEWVRPIDEIASSLWPTPTTQEVEHPQAELTPSGRRKSKNGKTSHSLGLADAVKMWPTPTAVTRPMEGNVRMYRAKIQAGEMTEAEAQAILGKSVWEAQGKVPEMWPTPRAAQAETRNHTVYARESGKPQNLENRIAQREPSAIGGKLNPMWVEWLMGFPTGWTDLKD
jgi:phage-related protein